MNKITLHKFSLISVCYIMSGCFSIMTFAAEPVAMITEYTGKVIFANNTEQLVDFGVDINQGDILKIDQGSSLTLTFYNGCRQEWIGENSTVAVGSAKSTFKQGKLLKAEDFECDVPMAMLGDDDSHIKAGITFRGAGKQQTGFDNNEELALPEQYKLLDRNDIKLKIWTNKKTRPHYRMGEQILIYLVAEQDVFLKLDYFQADGSVAHLVPNVFSDMAQIKRGRVYTIGGKNSKVELVAGEPFGGETIKVLISTKAFSEDFSSISVIEPIDDYVKTIKDAISSLPEAGGISEYNINLWTSP